MSHVNPPTKWGADHPQWKGDAASPQSKRGRARRRYALGRCERCGANGTDRHHRDHDPGNNVPENIEILCSRCHRVHGHPELMEKLRASAEPVYAAARAQTHCKHGHEFTADNTHIDGRGKRSCLECRRVAARASYWRRRAV